jgi:hypothetical protein
VNRQVDRMAEQGVLDFLDEQSLATHFGKRALLQAVAVGLDDDDAAGRPAGLDDTCRDGVRLPEGELTPSRPEAKFLRGHLQ